MKASELRIGNYINYEQTTHIIHQITNSVCGSYWHKSNASDSYTHTYNEINPIPLTEEWLIKFGFESVDYGTYFELTPKISDTTITLSLEFDDKDCYYQIGSDNDWTASLPILYVHQLQNLYFALTNKELQIK